MADLSDIALAAATGISILSFYPPANWPNVRKRLLRELGGVAVASAAVAAVSYGARLGTIDAAWLLDFALLCGGLFAWTTLMAHITRE